MLVSTFLIGSAGAWVIVVAAALLLRTRSYALFRAITLAVHTAIAAAIVDRFEPVAPAFFYLHATVFAHALVLVRPRLMPLPYRLLCSIPSAFFGAGTLLAFPWALTAAFGVNLPWPAIPYLLAAIGVAQSLGEREEEIDLFVADGQVVEGVRRHEATGAIQPRPLRLVQITDPHLGPFMSVRRLRGIAERAAQRAPDLVLLTGDFLTMESQSDPSLLAAALEPLAALPGKVFACFGNHDHEAPETVRAALDRIGAHLLVDAATLVETPAGPVQIVGVDHRWRGRREHLAHVTAEHPRVPRALRLVLLHDPSGFQHLPHGGADLVLSGHTHGGQIGLVSLGLTWTLMRLLSRSPDHGLWARGKDRLYVHRGTGHYGFPLRLGVPAEASLLRVHAASLRID